jgi:hypothetical protein
MLNGICGDGCDVGYWAVVDRPDDDGEVNPEASDDVYGDGGCWCRS